MTPDELKIALRERGWEFGPEIFKTGVDWYAWLRLAHIPDCTSNERPPNLILQSFEMESDGRVIRTVQFSITGEVAGNLWLELKAYSVPMAQALETIPLASELLKSTWTHAADRAKILNFGN